MTGVGVGLFLNPVLNGMSTSAFTWVFNRTGIIQNIAKTTAPLLKHAFLFGVLSGSIEEATSRLKEKVKKNYSLEASGRVLKGMELLHLLVRISSRYAVAKVSNHYFNTKISNEFVHLLSVSEIIPSVSSKNTSSIFISGFWVAIQAKVISLVIAVPIFKNSFYFGMIGAVSSGTILNTYLKIRAQIKENDVQDHSYYESCQRIEDNKLLFIPHLLLGIAPMYLSYKVANRVFKLNIPSNFAILLTLLSLPRISKGALHPSKKLDVFVTNERLSKHIEALKLDNLDRFPTRREIIKAYYRLALLYNPDKPNGNAEWFRRINEAKDALLEELI